MQQKNVLEYLEQSAERFGDKVAFADEQETVTFDALRSQAMGLAPASQNGSAASTALWPC